MVRVELEIKQVNLSDVENLRQIGITTFAETFAEQNTEADMQQYLQEKFSAKKIAQELSNPQSEFYFATFGEETVGYLKINFGEAQTEKQDVNALEIERIYVLKQFHGKKAGQILFDKALQIAKDRRVSYIWLGVWENNLRALKFYQKNGFVPFDKHVFKLGNDEQTDILMKLNLK